MEQSEQGVAEGSPAAALDLLPPTVALTRFEPAEGAHLAMGAARHEARARYGFRVGQLGFLIDPVTGSEVLSNPSVTPMPDACRGFLGLINVRGNIVPLYELQPLLGLEPREANATLRVLVFGQGEEAVAVVIDGYPAALTALRQLPHLPPLPETLQAHVAAGYVHGDAVWLEFRHGSFFDEICRGGSLATVAA